MPQLASRTRSGSAGAALAWAILFGMAAVNSLLEDLRGRSVFFLHGPGGALITPGDLVFALLALPYLVPGRPSTTRSLGRLALAPFILFCALAVVATYKGVAIGRQLSDLRVVVGFWAALAFVKHAPASIDGLMDTARRIAALSAILAVVGMSGLCYVQGLRFGLDRAVSPGVFFLLTVALIAGAGVVVRDGAGSDAARRRRAFLLGLLIFVAAALSQTRSYLLVLALLGLLLALASGRIAVGVSQGRLPRHFRVSRTTVCALLVAVLAALITVAATDIPQAVRSLSGAVSERLFRLGSPNMDFNVLERQQELIALISGLSPSDWAVGKGVGAGYYIWVWGEPVFRDWTHIGALTLLLKGGLPLFLSVGVFLPMRRAARILKALRLPAAETALEIGAVAGLLLLYGLLYMSFGWGQVFGFAMGLTLGLERVIRTREPEDARAAPAAEAASFA